MSAEKANHQHINSSESVEWYTPAKYIEAARTVLGGIDLDPASCEAANKIVKARRYFTERDNGYGQEWRGNVFLNPPYGWCYPDGRRKEKGGISRQGHWTRRLIEQYQAGFVTQAVLLVNANTSEKWFQPLWNYPICFVTHRIRFTLGEGTDTKVQPTKGNCFAYLGEQADRFAEVFQQFGRVVMPLSAAAVPIIQACVVCGSYFTGRRGARTCSAKCRQKAYHQRVTDNVTDRPYWSSSSYAEYTPPSPAD